MEIFIQSIDPDAWNAIVKGTFTPTKEVNGELVPKKWEEMKDDEKRKGQDDVGGQIDPLYIFSSLNRSCLSC